MFLLASLNNNAMAEEWSEVASTPDGDVTVYANQSTLRKEGNIVNIWTLGDFKKAEKIGPPRTMRKII